jgi:two-component system CheB/CheR fusion protein
MTMYQSTEPAWSRQLKILVVDDEPDAVMSTSMLLQAWGYDVCTASDGLGALEIATLEQPDVIMLDLVMPGLSGFELARRLREKDYFRRPFLIGQTGFADEEHRRQALEAGIDISFAKPLNCDVLKSILERFGQLVASPDS